MINGPRRLRADEIAALLAADAVAHLATLDSHGFPHVTPIWFVWDDGAFWMTSYADRPHLRRLEANPRAGICIDSEQPERDDGHRPNRQARAVGRVELLRDGADQWAARIRAKYLARSARPAVGERVAIRLEPDRLVAVASV